MKPNKKELESKVNQFLQEHATLNTNQLIKKAQQEKQQSTRKPQKSMSIPKPTQQQKQQKNEIKKEESNIQQEQPKEQIQPTQKEYSQISKINDHQLQMKIKEKQNELLLANEKLNLQDLSIKKLEDQIKQLQSLLKEKVENKKSPYNERRNLLLCYNVINKQQQIYEMSRIVQQTRTIQYELEHQLLDLSELVKGQAELIKIEGFCQRHLERLKYIQSQQQNLKEQEFEQNKNSQKNIIEALLKVDSCISQIINQFDQNKLQYNFIDATTISQLDALSMNLQQFIQTNLPKMTLKPQIILLEEQYQRIQGTFSTIFPHFNDINDLIKKQVENDLIYKEMQKINEECKIDQINSLAIRQINILRSLLIHTLLSLHTFKLKPMYQGYHKYIQPYLEDIKSIYEQYNQQNEEMGAQIIWNLCKSNYDKLIHGQSLIDQELEQLKKEYIGYWNMNKSN